MNMEILHRNIQYSYRNTGKPPTRLYLSCNWIEVLMLELSKQFQYSSVPAYDKAYIMSIPEPFHLRILGLPVYRIIEDNQIILT